MKRKANSEHKRLNARLHVSEWKRLAIVDATEDLEIDVSPDDIKYGARKDLGHCAFALACREKFDSRQVQFMHHRAYLDLPVEYDPKTRTTVRRVERFSLPAKTRRFVEEFDQGKKVAPGRYKLRAPAAYETLAAINKRRTNINKSGKPHPRKAVTVKAVGFIRSGTGVIRSTRRAA